jgi:hypothetical protein
MMSNGNRSRFITLLALPISTPGNFQEISWSGANMRITYTGQYRNLFDGASAVQLRIEATRGLLGSMAIDGGPDVDSMGNNLFRLPEGPVTTIGGIVTAVGNRSVYHHDMSSSTYLTFVLYVDHINPQNGLLTVNGLFASWSKPADIETLAKALEAKPPENPESPFGFGGFGKGQ